MRTLGVTGSDVDIDSAVEQWEGHALTLSILAAYLKEVHEGNILHVANIPKITRHQERYRHLENMLRHYDSTFKAVERSFLELFSLFRLPVQDSAFGKVFRRSQDTSALNHPLTNLGDREFHEVVARLVDRRILRAKHDGRGMNYTIHPLIRDYYLKSLDSNSTDVQNAHMSISEYYL